MICILHLNAICILQEKNEVGCDMGSCIRLSGGGKLKVGSEYDSVTGMFRWKTGFTLLRQKEKMHHTHYQRPTKYRGTLKQKLLGKGGGAEALAEGSSWGASVLTQLPLRKFWTLTGPSGSVVVVQLKFYSGPHNFGYGSLCHFIPSHFLLSHFVPAVYDVLKPTPLTSFHFFLVYFPFPKVLCIIAPGQRPGLVTVLVWESPQSRDHVLLKSREE